MNEIGKRLRSLRESVMLSQAKLAVALGTNQSTINRYENNQTPPTVEMFLKYADYFDVSMDYLYCRCDTPQGRQYEFNPTIRNNDELRRFVDMCFDPESPMSEKLKATLVKMLAGEVES